jgi:hypothetical protein
MPIDVSDGVLILRDTVTVDDAESLREQLAAAPALGLDLGACSHLHTAALQVLMAAARPVRAWPADPVCARWMRSALLPTPPLALLPQEMTR